MRALDIMMPSLHLSFDWRQQDEDGERAKILRVAVERLALGLSRPVGQRPEGAERAEGGRASQIGVRQVEQPVLRRQLQQMRARPQVEIVVTGKIAVARNVLECGNFSF